MKYLFNFLAGILVMTIFLLIFQKIYLDKKDSLTKTTKNKIVNTPTVKPTEIIIPTAAITRGPTTPPIVGKIFSIRPNNDLTIQEAVDLAQPGDTVVLSPGEYFQDVVTKKDGLPDKPITIKGQKSSIVKGAGNSRVFQVNHSYITLEGFTIDGHFKNSKEISSYRDKLLYVTGKIAGKALVNLKVFNMDIKNAGGECVRLRYLVQNSEIAYNSIFTCGVGDFEYNDGGKDSQGSEDADDANSEAEGDNVKIEAKTEKVIAQRKQKADDSEWTKPARSGMVGNANGQQKQGNPILSKARELGATGLGDLAAMINKGDFGRVSNGMEGYPEVN